MSLVVVGSEWEDCKTLWGNKNFTPIDIWKRGNRFFVNGTIFTHYC
jgi:hypothetical protein